MGSHQLKLMSLAMASPGWHDYPLGRESLRAIATLSRQGLVDHDRRTRRYRVKLPARVWDALEKSKASAFRRIAA